MQQRTPTRNNTRVQRVKALDKLRPTSLQRQRLTVQQTRSGALRERRSSQLPSAEDSLREVLRRSGRRAAVLEAELLVVRIRTATQPTTTVAATDQLTV